MDMEAICFEMICHAGEARSSFIEAIQKAKQGDFVNAEKLIASGKESYRLGHAVHLRLIQTEMEGKGEPPALILIHAEDHMMNAENFKILSEEFVELYQHIKGIAG